MQRVTVTYEYTLERLEALLGSVSRVQNVNTSALACNCNASSVCNL